MRSFYNALGIRSVFSKPGCFFSAGFAILLCVTAASGQSPAPQTPGTQPAAAQPPSTQAPVPAAIPSNPSAPADTQKSDKSSADKNPTVSAGAFSIQTVGGEIKEDQLKQMLVGKTLYLRSGYMDNNLEFDEQGRLTSHSPQGSFTLSQIQINKVKVSKHKIELQGDRYALHFLGAAPYEDPTKATDRVKITPKKKTVRISFERERVEIPKKKKEKHKKDHDKESAKSGKHQPEAAPVASDDSATQTESATDPGAIASHPADSGKQTTTTSPAHASRLLLTAFDKVFSQGIDDRMVASMPDFWKLYYQAAQAKSDIKPVGAGIYSDNNVDQKAKLISVLDPPSNEFAQANGVAGIAMYHALVGSDGKVEAVVAGRPIGFGLDESAAQSIRKATFQPAIKDGKPVPVALDLVVSFRIYSKRTSQPAPQEAAEEKPNQPVLPGPYTVQAMEQAHAAQQTEPAQPPQPEQPAQPASSTQPDPTAQPLPTQPAPATQPGPATQPAPTPQPAPASTPQ